MGELKRYDIRSYDSGWPPTVLAREAGVWVSYEEVEAELTRLRSIERAARELLGVLDRNYCPNIGTLATDELRAALADSAAGDAEGGKEST